MSTIKLHQLQALVASAEAGSIRGAARTLGLSQAAVTRAARELEASERLPLLVRAPEGSASPNTEDAAHAREARAEAARTRAERSRCMRGRVEGRLSIGVTPWLTMTFSRRRCCVFGSRCRTCASGARSADGRRAAAVARRQHGLRARARATGRHAGIRVRADAALRDRGDGARRPSARARAVDPRPARPRLGAEFRGRR